MTTTDSRVDPGQPSAWMPPPASLGPPYVAPYRPRRTGLFLFWPTLALIAIALGTLGIFDASHTVTISAYAALAVAVTGAMLFVGAFVGRPGGLIALGLVAATALAVTSIVGAATGSNSIDNKDLRDTPATAAALQPAYQIQTGTMEIDLRKVTDLAALNNRTVDLGVNAGEVSVLVPPGLNVHVDARIRYAGQIDIGADQRSGFGQSMERTLATSSSPGTPTLNLTIDIRVGQITVAQR